MRNRTREELLSMREALDGDPRTKELEVAKAEVLEDPEASALFEEYKEAVVKNSVSMEAMEAKRKLLDNGKARRLMEVHAKRQSLLREMDLILFGAFQGLKDA